MYRYTEKKNRQANQKFAAKQKTRQSARKSSARSTQTKAIKSRTKRQDQSKKAAAVSKKAQEARKKQQEWFDMAVTVVTYFLVCVLVGILLLGIYVTCMNNLLPQFFRVDQTKNVLLVGSDINGRPEKIYLLRYEPTVMGVQIWELAPDIEVQLVGQYNYYPLSSVGALVYRYGEDLQEVKAAYNFALGQVLDEYYFIPDLESVETRTDLQSIMGDLWRAEWVRTGKMDGELTNLYFAVRGAKFVDVQKVETPEQLAAMPAVTGREQLVKCKLWIYNAAAANGLAKRVKKILESGGAAVIKLETATENLERSVIYYDQTEDDCVQLVELLQETLPKGVDAVPDGGDKARRQRAEAILYLGEELAK